MMRLILPALLLASMVFFSSIGPSSESGRSPSQGSTRHTSGRREEFVRSNSGISELSEQSSRSEQSVPSRTQGDQRYSGLVVSTQQEHPGHSSHSRHSAHSEHTSRSPPYIEGSGITRSSGSLGTQLEYLLSREFRNLGRDDSGREYQLDSPQSIGSQTLSGTLSPRSSLPSHLSSPRGPFSFEFDSLSDRSESSSTNGNNGTHHAQRP